MLDKNVCPKCGQLYALELDNCPLCGAPAPSSEFSPVHRERISEEERRRRTEERRRAQRSDLQSNRASRKEQKAAAERYLQQQEENDRRTRLKEQMLRHGTTEAEERARIPSAYLVISVLLLLAALLVGTTYLLWRADVLEVGIYNQLSAPAQAAQVETTAGDSIKLDVSTVELTAVGQMQQLTASLTANDPNGVISYQSSAPEIATVDKNGLITALSSGEADITVSCGSAKAVCHVTCVLTQTASDPNVPLELNYTQVNLDAKGAFVLLQITNADNTGVIWSSSDSDIVSVNSDGRATAVAEGTAEITATIGSSIGTCSIEVVFE